MLEPRVTQHRQARGVGFRAVTFCVSRNSGVRANPTYIFVHQYVSLNIATPARAVWVYSSSALPGEGMGSGAVRDRKDVFLAPLSPHLPPGDRSIRVLIRHIRSPAFCIRMSSIEPGLGVRISAHWTGINPRSSFRYRQGGFDRIVRLRFSEAGKTAARLPAGSHARS